MRTLKHKLYVVVTGICLATAAPAQTAPVQLTVDFSAAPVISRFHTGVVHAQYSLDPWGDSLAVENGKTLLQSAAVFQNQHIMGWGASNPWPDSTVTNPQNWNWQSLDRRVQLIRSTGGVPVITLCGCPTWMFDPSWNGSTDWSRLETAPLPGCYPKFALLAKQVAMRYPDVVYFQVWNEMKGFHNPTLNRWNYENYTQLYNAVYDSIKSVRPDAKIGGPYVVMNSWSSSSFSHPSNLTGPYGVIDQRALDVITYWMDHKNGADFITIDGGTDNVDNVWTTDAFSACQKFSDVNNWIKNLPGSNAALPVWWAEWYAKSPASAPQNNLDYYNAVMSAALIQLIRAESETALLWQPEGDRQGFSFPEGLWTGTDTAGGGQPTPFYFSMQAVRDHFSTGTPLYPVSGLPGTVSALASAEKMLLVNHLPDTVPVSINGENILALTAYEVRITDMPALPPPSDYALVQNFPNPFTISTTLVYALPEAGEVDLRICDLTGRTIRTLVHANQDAGTYHIALDGTTLPAGSYCCRLTVTGAFEATCKMIVLKH